MARAISHKPELVSTLVDRVSSGKLSPCLIHGGHFILDNRGSDAVHNLPGDRQTSPIAEDFARFAGDTWMLAVSLKKRLEERSQASRLMVLVNDWQFLRGEGNSRREVERDIARRRDAYYQRFQRLPPFHDKVLDHSGMGDIDIFKSSSKRWLFSETALRSLLAKSIQRLFEENLAEERGLAKSFTPAGDPIVSAGSVNSELERDFCLLYCGSTNCAGEVVELLRIVWEAGFRSFLNLYPMQCLGPVGVGTRLAQTIYKIRDLHVFNVAAPFGAGGGDYILDEFRF